MATLKELEQQVDDLQVSLDNEQEQVRALLDSQTQAISDLESSVADLQALLADGGTPEERMALSSKLAAIKEDLESTVEDVSTTSTTTEESTVETTTEEVTPEPGEDVTPGDEEPV